MKKIIWPFVFCLLVIHAEGQTNTFPSSGNTGIGTTTPVTKLEVVGDIKSSSTNYDYYHVVSLASYSASTWYPVVLEANGVGGPVKFEIIRKSVHEDGSWYGSIHFVGVFNSSGWGNSSSQFQYKYEECCSVNLVSYIGQQFHGSHIIIYLRGGRHYYIKSNTEIENLSSVGNAYTIQPGVTNEQITVSPTTNIDGDPPTAVPSGGIESIEWRKALPNTSLSVSGNIGIGLSNPSQRLEVRGNGARIRLSASTDPSKYYFDIQSNPTDTNTVNFYATNGNNILKYAAGANTIALQPLAGNVLIGKTSQTNSSYKLDVNGNIRANRITVNTTGADYVFDSTYYIPSIDSLNRYISRYRHLPGFASAAEMQVEGVNLGAAQIHLLQNLEEMTLYIIEMHKKIEHLTLSQIDANKRIAELEDKDAILQNEIVKMNEKMQCLEAGSK
jgi:hypothetical protein